MEPYFAEITEDDLTALMQEVSVRENLFRLFSKKFFFSKFSLNLETGIHCGRYRLWGRTTLTRGSNRMRPSIDEDMPVGGWAVFRL